jgi:hypothetical protein
MEIVSENKLGCINCFDHIDSLTYLLNILYPVEKIVMGVECAQVE